jgi:methionyl-tRNA formyltransferase
MVWATRVPRSFEPEGAPGVVMGVEKDGLRVGVRGGSIVITRMSDEGGKPQHARRWYRRARLAAGTRFDPVAPELAMWARGERSRPAVAG